MAGWSCIRRRAPPRTSASCWSSPTQCPWQRYTSPAFASDCMTGCRCMPAGSAICTPSFLLMQEWVDRIVADDKLWDQNAFNELMTRGMQIAPRREDRLFL